MSGCDISVTKLSENKISLIQMLNGTEKLTLLITLLVLQKLGPKENKGLESDDSNDTGIS